MGVLITCLVFFLFWLRIKSETSANKLRIIVVLLAFVAFSLFLNWYMEAVYLYEYGIPGSDLRLYFDSAQALANGSNISDLVKLSAAFDTDATGLGYIIYIVFLYLMIFAPIIISIPFSLNLVYLVQIIVAIIAALNIADVFESSNVKKRNGIFYMLVTCAAVFQMPALLMRDIWILFLISYLMYGIVKKNMSIWKCILVLLLTTIMRSYSLMLTIPILIFYKFRREKLAVVFSIGIFGAMFLGQDIISMLADAVGIKWKYDFNVDLLGLVSFILYPNPINQSQNIQHIQTGYHVNFGGNTEWIYYLLACWNVYIYPLATIGIIKTIKRRVVNEAIVWGAMILNIAVLYGIFYDSASSPRHKLMLVMSLAYFFAKGIEDKSKKFKIIYSLLIIMMMLLLLLITN